MTTECLLLPWSGVEVARTDGANVAVHREVFSVDKAELVIIVVFLSQSLFLVGSWGQCWFFTPLTAIFCSFTIQLMPTKPLLTSTLSQAATKQ